MLASSMDQLKNFCIQSMGNKKPPISEDSSAVPKVYIFKVIADFLSLINFSFFQPLQPDANAAKPEFVKPSANATEQLQESMKL